MKRRNLNEINAGSMADIAFLLLIFFLVTTTMNSNSGLQRKLPPFEKKKKEHPVLERNVMPVHVNQFDAIAIRGFPVSVNTITEKTKEFFTNPNKDENLPEFKMKVLPFIGDFEVSKGLVSLQTDRNTSYEVYLKVQNELVRAVNELRDDLSLKLFNLHFDDLPKDKQDAVSDAYPLAISEAEPRRMTSETK